MDAIANAIVQSYVFNETDDPLTETKKITGGMPIQKLVENMQFNVQRGGQSVKENFQLPNLDNYGVPIGLVYQSSPAYENIKWGGERPTSDTVNVISSTMYDKLVNEILETPSREGSRKTLKRIFTHKKN